MAVVIAVDKQTKLPGGETMIRGTLSFSTYTAGGEALNLSNYLKSTGYPTVVVEGGEYGFRHDKEAAANGSVLVFEKDYTNDSNVFKQVANGATITQNVGFFAIGPQY
jgi:hypothetical protein